MWWKSDTGEFSIYLKGTTTANFVFFFLFRANTELMKMFLKVVLFVFEHPLLLTSDYAEKLEDAFHWGLTAQVHSLSTVRC